jgi:hypothetical protein
MVTVKIRVRDVDRSIARHGANKHELRAAGKGQQWNRAQLATVVGVSHRNETMWWVKLRFTS